MSIQSVLARGRRAAEARMTDRCTIRRGATVLYAGRCEIAQDDGVAREDGDGIALDLRLVLKLPMSVTGLRLGDEATMDASASDPDLVGRVLRIQDLAHESHATARRLRCIERTAETYLRGDDDRSWTA